MYLLYAGSSEDGLTLVETPYYNGGGYVWYINTMGDGYIYDWLLVLWVVFSKAMFQFSKEGLDSNAVTKSILIKIVGNNISSNFF